MKFSRQSGVTLLELLVVLFVLGVMLSGLGVIMSRMVTDAKLEGTIEEGRKIALAADRLRLRALDTTVDAEGIYHHAYASLPADSQVADLDAIAGALGLPSQSPFDTPYRVEITDHVARVRVEVPISATPAGVEAIPLGADRTDLVIYPHTDKVPSRKLVSKPLTDKQVWYLESPRR